MKKNLLIALFVFLTIGIVTANASKSFEVKTNKINSKFESKKNSNFYLKPALISSFSMSETCDDGSIYVTIGLLWCNDDGSIYTQTVHYGNECPITPPSSQP
jgi:hypothetical protein